MTGKCFDKWAFSLKNRPETRSPTASVMDRLIPAL